MEKLISEKAIDPQDVERMYFNVDEHSTATNGKYELKENLEQEFKNGTYNTNYSIFFPPLFHGMADVQLEFCDSSAPNKRLVRAADIIANKIYYLATNNRIEDLNKIQNMSYIIQP